MKYLKYLLYLLVVLAIVFFVSGMLNSSVSYESEVSVNKPAEIAWQVMSDESNLSKWIEGYLRTEHVSGTANTVGAISNVYVDNNGEEMVMQETITELIPNEKMAMTFTMDMMDMDYEIIFTEENGKTNIKSKTSTTGNGMIAKSMISFMGGTMKEQEDKNLNNLKKLIEG